MTRVLAVIPSNTFGGAHNQVGRLSTRLADHGFETSVLLPDEDGDATSRLRQLGIPVYQRRLLRPKLKELGGWPRYVLGLPRQIWMLHQVMRELDINLVQAHGLLQIDVAFASLIGRRRLVWQLLDTRPPRWLAALLTPLMATLSHSIMTTGTTTARAYPGLERSRRTIVPFYPPVDLGEVSVDSRTHEYVTFGCLANFNPQKRQDHLIRAFVEANVSHSAQLLLRGAVTPGHENVVRDLRSLIERLGARNVILDTAPIGPAEFLPTLDVLLLASAPRSEGTPTVIIEAMHLGVPAVATDVGGVRELIHDGVSGHLAEAGDIHALAKHIRSMTADPQRRRGMGLAAKERADRTFTIGHAVEAYLKAYRAALPGSRP